MGLPVIIVEFGQQRQRLKLNKLVFTTKELLELFSATFHIACNSEKYEVLSANQRLDSMREVNFAELGFSPRFEIRSIKNQTQDWLGRTDSNENELVSLKQRLSIASMEISHVAALLSSIQKNYQNLIQALVDEENRPTGDLQPRACINLPVPPGFRALSSQATPRDQKPLNHLSRGSSSPDEGIDRDIGGVSIFESAHSEPEPESVYLECREDNTIINTSQSLLVNNKSKLEWRNQPNPSHPFWNSHALKCKPYHNKTPSDGKPRANKSANSNKAPLPPEKKKNIPCKYAAGGNCRRGKL